MPGLPVPTYLPGPSCGTHWPTVGPTGPQWDPLAPLVGPTDTQWDPLAPIVGLTGTQCTAGQKWVSLPTLGSFCQKFVILITHARRKDLS